MQLRNGKKYTSVTFEEFKIISNSITDAADSRLYTSYKLFKHINNEFPQMYHKMANTVYNKGRNLYVVVAYQKSAELITTLLKQAYDRETKITDLHKQRIVKTLYELHQAQIIMRRLIWEIIVQDKDVKNAMSRLSTTSEIDESKFETKLYRCLMHMYDNNVTKKYSYFTKSCDYSDVEMYDLFYSDREYTYIYNNCFTRPIENVNTLYWL
jgi:hypothetical protein